MYRVPPAMQRQFAEYLDRHGVPQRHHVPYQKWLRYYLDYCHKYQLPHQSSNSLPAFINKLVEKRQSLPQRTQAEKAIAAYYALMSGHPAWLSETAESVKKQHHQNKAYINQVSRAQRPPPVTASTAGFSEPPVVRDVSGGTVCEHEEPGGQSWQREYSRLADEIRVRHYSPKTLRSYRSYVGKFQAFTKSKAPESLTTDDVKTFLTHLAVNRKVAAATQNLAFNALLFFFRHVLGKDFGVVDGVVRAKKRPYIPVVLAREEIEAILRHLEPPYDLVVKLLYGCGLRLFECLELRVHCLNFAEGIITIHDGKGQKDRTVPLPHSILDELRAQVVRVKATHKDDLRRGYAGVFLANALDKKYKNAAREFIWQWLFPAKQLTRESGTRALRRYHLHATHVQKALKKAVAASEVCKRVTAHSFRHSFASHLLQHNFDIRTIQQLLGHADVRTTMIYTHTVKSSTIKEAQSPLDLE